MSTTIDSRVVEMRFDNKQFESNVHTSLSTLDKLKEKLKFNGASAGLENINAAAKNVDMNGLGSAIETVKARFSALEVIGVTALVNIANSAINTGKRMLSALTIDPIKTGLDEYELKINSIQTIMSNTANKGTTMKEVTETLDELNTYADKTIYNFAEMTRNIGTFTAAGVGLKDSASAIQGIANLAAASGSSSQQASTAMYQLSQALAAGTVKLMDWNSVVNAGMGGQKFQEALKATAREHGIAIDSLIEKNGSFRESLQEGWLSADVLNETLKKFTVEGAKEYAQSMMDSGKWTQAQADALIKEAQAMEDAATKVKTFTQLWDTLKEAAQSGWAQSWEIIIGDFEEAKELFTEISDVIGGVIAKSAESRNKVLQEWKDLGGRTALVEAMRNTFEGLGSIIKPISQAFREIFPPVTAKQLVAFSEGIRDLTAKLKISDTTAKNLKRTFKGVFSVIGIFTDAIKAIVKGAASLIGSFTGIEGGIFAVTAAIGDWISNFRNSIKEANIFEGAVKGITNIMTTVVEKMKEFVGMNSTIGSTFSSLSTGIADAIGSMNFDKLFALINGGLFGSILLAIKRFIENLTGSFSGGVGGVLSNIKGILDDVRGCFEAYQEQLKAGTLMKIASAIAILAGALFLISTINPGALAKSLAAITVLFAELMGSLRIFSGLSTNLGMVMKGIPLMIGLGVAITILAGALKILSTIDMAGIAKGLVGIAGLMLELAIFLKVADLGGKVTTSAVGLVILSSSLLILASAVEHFSNLNMKELGTGLIGMAGALLVVSGALKLLPGNMIVSGIGLLSVAVALKTLAVALASFGSMSWTEIAKGLAVMGGALLELAIGLKIMSGTLAGSAALLIASGALMSLSVVLKSLGNLSWSGIAKGLIALAGGFVVMGVAGALLTPLIPAILGLCAAFALLGATVLAIGGGLTLIGIGLTAIATGFTALAAAGTAGAAAVVSALNIIVTGIANLIPTIASKLAEGVLAFCVVIGECAPQIAKSIFALITEVLAAMSTYGPQIVDYLLTFLIDVLNGVAARMPELLSAVMNVVGAFFQSIVDALNGLDASTILKGTVCVGLLTAMMFALSAIVGLIPGAMLGVLGMGAVIAELSLVLAAIGALSQIPGLEWLVSEGGQFLETVGTAIGQFVGGIVGGIAQGVTSSLPAIGSDLSAFMTNLQPFIDGAKQIDPSAAEGVKALAQAILILTGANLLDAITSFLTGGSSLADFGKQLVPFGQSMKAYSDAVTGIDAEAVTASANAAKALGQLSANLPNSGGLVSLFTGDNDLTAFASKLVPFGRSIKAYADTVVGLDANAVTASATAAKSLSELATNLPNSGGLVSLFTGDNDISSFAKKLVPFGQSMKEYSSAVSGMDVAAVSGATTVAKKLVVMINEMAGIDTSGVNSFKEAINTLSKVNIQGVLKAFNGSSAKFSSAGKNIISAIAKGMRSGSGAVNSAATSIANSISKVFQSKSSSMHNAGTDLVNKFINGVNSRKTAIINVFTSTLQAAISKIRSYYGSFVSSGSYLGSGLVVGINSKQSAAYNAGYALGQAAVRGEKAGQKSNSPSKLTIQSGKWLGEGLVIGMKTMLQSVIKTGRTLGSAAADSLSTAMSSVNALLDSGIEATPSISPIVDLSDVNRSLGYINTVFGNGVSLDVASNINTISSSMGRRNQNGIYTDIVSAIDKLRRDVGNIEKPSYTINGITYDDGSNISSAIETLVRAAKIERRV